MTTERRREAITDDAIERIASRVSETNEVSFKRILTEHDAHLGINSSTFEGVEKFRKTMSWAENGMENTASAKRYVLGGIAALIVAAAKGLYVLYESMSGWIAIHTIKP